MCVLGNDVGESSVPVSGRRTVAWRPGAGRVEDIEHDRSQAFQAARPGPHAPHRRALYGRPPPRRGGVRAGAWELRGGIHGDTAAFANVLANLGVVHPGEPLSEAMVLGVGGGLGAGYILWEFESYGYRALMLGFRRQWQYPARWAAETAERLGLHAEFHETGGARPPRRRSTPSSTAACRDRLDRRRTARPPRRAGVARRLRRAADRRLRRARATATRSTTAPPARDRRRATVSRPPAARVVSFKHRLITIDPELVDLDGDRLRAAVEEGLRLQVEHLSAKSDSFSLPAWRKWARMTTDTRNKKGWPKRVRRRARDRQPARLDLHERGRRRAPARALRRLPRRGGRPARAPCCAKPRRRGARPRRRGT